MCKLRDARKYIFVIAQLEYSVMLKRAPNRESMFNRKEIVDLPNLIEIQLRSYDQFLQAEILPEDRRNIGLEETFREVFPVRSYDEKTVIEYLSYHLGSSTYNQDECLRRGITFGATLKVKFRLTDETGIKEEEVYMGTIPLMTDRGTFVINGAERVVVSQLHRSPGIAFGVDKFIRLSYANSMEEIVEGLNRLKQL